MLILQFFQLKYRQVRDEHIIHDLLANLKKRLKGRSSLEYFELSDIVCRIGGIAVISERRCIVWQRICLKEVSYLPSCLTQFSIFF